MSHNVLWGHTPGGRGAAVMTAPSTSFSHFRSGSKLALVEAGGYFHRDLLWETQTSRVPFEVYPSGSPADLGKSQGRDREAASLQKPHPSHP